jgi:peptide/nickel transport system permease protein
VTRFVLRRLLHGLLVAALVTITVFFATRVLTDPAKLLLPIGSSEQQRDTLRSSMGLNDPLSQQFATFLGDVARFDFGTSAWQHLPARELVFERLPATFTLVAAGTLAAVALFVPLGVVAAMRPGRWPDRAVSLVSLGGLSLPQFWVGAMLIWLFAVRLGWLPTSGKGGWQHLVLPAFTLALTSGGRVALTTRNAMVEQLRAPYVEAARAKGLPERTILVRHVLRNALIPVVTLSMWEVANNMAGAAVVVETVFAWPGIGLLLINAVRFNDIFLIQAIVFITALLIVATNFVTDLLYKAADPRLEIA